jgi:hypothetical protein
MDTKKGDVNFLHPGCPACWFFRDMLKMAGAGIMSQQPELNRRQVDYESTPLPTEVCWLEHKIEHTIE